MQTRRHFIKSSLTGSAMLAMPLGANAFFKPTAQRLVILHTNDLHSHIDPFPHDDGRYPGMGGFAQLAALIATIRKENNQVLLLDSGDIFQGTPYFNFYQGSLELKLMSKMNYDAATLGNHEFDNGIDSLSRQLRHASFPFINSNYDFSATLLEDMVLPWKVFQKGSIRVGILGLGLDPKGLIAESNYNGIVYNDPILKGDAAAQMLKEKKQCHLVIALTHLGFKMDFGRVDDLQLATQTKHIDIILGGHSHTFMNEPVIKQNAAGRPVIIHHSGQYGVRLGRLDLLCSKEKFKTTTTHYEVKQISR